jgi:single-stranded DNA-binding protein
MSAIAVDEIDNINIVVLVGEVTSPPVSRELPSGSVVSTFDIATVTSTGRVSVPISLEGETEAAVVGAEVCVVGLVRRRFFRSGASVASRTEVVAQSVIPVRRRAQVRKAVGAATENILAFLDG